MKHFGILIGILALVVCAGCGSGESKCDGPDVSGTWYIDQHCEASFEGMQIDVSTSGCSFEVTAGAFPGFTGSVTATGSITLGGTVDTYAVSCTGTATGIQMTMTCTDDCGVSFRR